MSSERAASGDPVGSGFTCQCCRSGRLRRLGSSRDFPEAGVLSCAECELSATYPPPGPDELARFYAGEYSEANKGRQLDFKLYDLRAEAQFRTIRASGALGPAEGEPDLAGRHVLEIGCGPGSLLLEFARRGAVPHGYDADPAVVEAAAGRFAGPAHLHRRGFDPGEPDREDYDLILMSHVLEHIPSPVDYLRRLAGLLGPGGVMFIEVPNYSPRRASRFLWRAVRGTGHVNFFSRASLSRAASEAGLEVAWIGSAGPPRDRVELPFGRGASRLHGAALAAERVARGVLRRLGSQSRPWQADGEAKGESPPGVEGLVLRMVAGLAGPA